MVKYYRVIKDHPLWEVGAILSNENASQTYGPVEDIWNKVEGCTDYRDGSGLVEKQPEFYERVYRDNLDKAVFYTKESLKTLYKKFKK